MPEKYIKENGNGITFGYYINEDELVLFEQVNNIKLEFGFVVAIKSFVIGDTPLNSDGTEAETTKGSVVKAVATNSEYNYSGYDFKLTGHWDGKVDLDGDDIPEADIKDIEFYMSGYVFDGTVNYIQGNEATSSTVTPISYNQVNQ